MLALIREISLVSVPIMPSVVSIVISVGIAVVTVLMGMPQRALQLQVFRVGIWSVVELVMRLSLMVVRVLIMSRSGRRKREDSQERQRREERLGNFGLHNNSFLTVQLAEDI